jgi:hypothetical protein
VRSKDGEMVASSIEAEENNFLDFFAAFLESFLLSDTFDF